MDDGKRHEYLEVLAVFLLGLVLRLFAGRNALQGGDVLFAGYDDFYHMRRILYTVANFPNTLWFDSYLNYPYGMNLTWPPFFDQLLAAVSLAFGQHSQHGIELVSATVPVFIGSIAIVAVYYMVKEIFDRKAAIMSAFMTALAPYYLQKSMLGETDHHSLEVLLLIFAIMFLVLALSNKERRILFAVVAGVSMAGLAYTWLGSSAYFGIILIYALAQMTLDLKNGVSSEATVTTLLTALGVTLAFTLPFWSTTWLFPSFFGTVAIIAAIVILFVISKLIAKGRAPWAVFPIAVVVLAGIFIMLSKLLSGFWIFSKVNEIIVTGGDYLLSGEMIGKISEAEPLFARPEIFFSNFLFSNLGWNLLFSVAGLAVLINSMKYSKQNAEKKEVRLLFLVFAIFTLILTIGQIRFLELSSITMGILISVLFFRTVEAVEKNAKGRSRQSKFLIIVLFLVLVLPTVKEAASISNSKPEIAGDWYESLNWLETNSNATSNYDSPDKAPEYSVLSWWDYGNWILYQAKRPVVVSNFQNKTAIKDVTKFFLSEDEKTATDVLDGRGVRYIVTDYNMLYGKFPAIAIWANQDPSAYITIKDLGSYMTATPTVKLIQTTLARLHFFDGSGMGRLRLIHESHTIDGRNPATSELKIFEYVPGAVIKVSTAPGMKVVAMLEMVSNQGRTFYYENEGKQEADGYEIRVPYSTEKRYDTHSVAPYLVTAGNSTNNTRTQKINVTEDDVLYGKVIDVSL